MRSALLVAAASAALAASLPLAASAAAAECPGAGARPETVKKKNWDAALLCLINDARAGQGLPPLEANAKLRRAAVGHTKAMVKRRKFAHGDFQRRIRRTGYLKGAHRWLVGENLGVGRTANGSPRDILGRWLRSTPHRVNLFNRHFRDAGIGSRWGAPHLGTRRSGVTVTIDFGVKRG